MPQERKCDRWWGTSHRFDQWKVKEDSTITRSGDKKEVIGRWLLQERKCLKCGFIELNKQIVNL